MTAEGSSGRDGAQPLESFFLDCAGQVAAARLKACLDSDQQLVENLWGRVVAPADGTVVGLVLFGLFEKQRCLLAEFIQGESVPEFAERTDPCSIERSMPMFCRLFDALERLKSEEGSWAAPEPSANRAFDPVDFGIAVIRQSALTVNPASKLHGSISVSREQVLAAQISGGIPDTRTAPEPDMVQLYRSLAEWVLTGARRKRQTDPVAFWLFSELARESRVETAVQVNPKPPATPAKEEPLADRQKAVRLFLVNA